VPALITIIMPVFNAAKYVSEAIESVLNQTYTSWELIIVNDASTDNSEVVIKKFQDSRIRYFYQEHGGVSKARNVGLADMQGQYFCFLDADDVLPRESLESRLSIFNDAVDFVDGTVKVFDSEMGRELTRWAPKRKGDVINNLVRLNGYCFFGPTWMVKRKNSVSYKMREDLKHGEDLIFYISIANMGSYSYTPETILHYRKHGQSAMHNTEGLANGYAAMRRILFTEFRSYFRLLNRCVYDFKTRKIIFLEFLRQRKYKLSVLYLINGSLQ